MKSNSNKTISFPLIKNSVAHLVERKENIKKKKKFPDGQKCVGFQKSKKVLKSLHPNVFFYYFNFFNLSP